jgi:exosortase
VAKIIVVSMSENQSNDSAIPAGGVPEAAPTLQEPQWLGLPQTTWIQIAVVTGLFGCLFWPNLRRLWDKTNPFYGEANWGHAIGVPIIGLYYLYVNREKLLNPDPLPRTMFERTAMLKVWGMFVFAILLQLSLVYVVAHDWFIYAAAPAAMIAMATLACWWWDSKGKIWQYARAHSAAWFGGSIVLFGIEFFGYGIYPGQNDFFKDIGMVITLFGVVLALTGWARMKIAWFPVAFLVCGIPWSGLMYSRIASPLQQMAARAAVTTLQLTGVDASAGGTKIVISGHGNVLRTLNVAEACAGLRSLMTFISVGAAVAFLSNRPLWQKIGITLSAIPIAISCNVMRVSGQGLLDHYVSQKLSENFAHQFVGMIMLIPAFLLILLVGWLLDQIFLQEADHRRAAPKMIRRATVAVPQRALPRPGLATGRPTPAIAGAGPVSNTIPRPTMHRSPTPPRPPSGVTPPRPISLTPPPSVRLASGVRNPPVTNQKPPSTPVPPPTKPVPSKPPVPKRAPNTLPPNPKREAI